MLYLVKAFFASVTYTWSTLFNIINTWCGELTAITNWPFVKGGAILATVSLGITGVTGTLTGLGVSFTFIAFSSVLVTSRLVRYFSISPLLFSTSIIVCAFSFNGDVGLLLMMVCSSFMAALSSLFFTWCKASIYNSCGVQ